VEWGKVACWSTKAAISLKHVKIDEKLLWRAYRNSPTLFRTVPSPTPTAFLPQDWGSQLQPKSAIAIISGTRIATDCKFGRYIHRFHPNNSTLKIFGEQGEWAYPGTAQSCEYTLLSLERVMLYELQILYAHS